MKDLPVFKITIEDDLGDIEGSGIDQIAFTKNPAIKVKGMAFTSSLKPLYFSDGPKMRIAAPAMIPMEIYRHDDEDGEHYVKFTVEQIEKIFVKFMSNLNNTNKFNLEHNTDKTVKAFVLEAWLVGKDNKGDRSYSEFGVLVPEGTMFLVTQITDQEEYNNLVKNNQVGYSIEGFFAKYKFSEINKKINMAQKLMIKEDELITINDKVYYLKDGVLTEKIEEEQLIEDPKDPKSCNCGGSKFEEIVTEEVDTETVTIDEAKIMEIIAPKLEELYNKIAELQVKLDNKVDIVEEKKIEEVEMTAHQRFTAIQKLINKK